MKRLVRRRLREVYPRLAILVTSKQFYKKFIIERETFLYNLQDHDFMIKDKRISRVLEEFKEGSDEQHKQKSRNQGP